MTPEARAARDRLARYAGPDWHFAGPDFPEIPGGYTGADINQVVEQCEQGVHDTLAPDIRTVLAALDQHEAHLEAVRQDIRQVAAEAGFSPVPDRVQITYGMPPKTDTQRMVELYLNPPGMPYGSTPHPQTSDQSSQEGAP